MTRMNRSAAIEAFYVSWEWRKRRKKILKSRHYLCERCLKRGIIETGSKKQPLEVHHKIPLTDDNINDPNITLGEDNLEVLCKKCHDEEREKKQKRWKVGTDGKVIL